ncbi:RHS repeat-associated core domain-containing protein [Nonomuraea sp. NPDC005650]|uniref:RHS repeat domain-containing protein n=1 Tax=Nonomuraea sp. NPDC005650 TaxID=3157045 RepID=UPI0033B398DB
MAETATEPSTTAHPNAADRTWTHVYDEAGNPKATIQPGGVRIDRTFDRLGRLTKESGAGGGAATAERTFGYDLAGRRTAAGDLTVDYNDRGLPLKVSRGTVQETAYGYDGIGTPTQRIDASGTATFTYDSANRLKTATDPVTSRTLTYGYDAASRLKTITATTGTASTQTIDYDDMDRVTGQTLKNGSGTQLSKITYEWDKDDNLTSKTTAGTAGAGINTYGYDHAGRLTSWTAPSGATTAYEWDAAGNRTKAGNATFTYDERNRLTNGNGTDYTYTPRGTLATSTKAGATTQYTFDAFDRLIADGDNLYSYDALDRMTSRIRGTAKHTFAYSGLGNDLAAITDSGGAVQAKYARDLGGGLLGLKEGTAAAVATLSDLHGDLVATYTTTLQTSTAYDPFGTVTAQTGTKTNVGYQGEYTDPDTGKVNMHARWYQPGTGTFTSRDTATLTPNPSVQANRYTYANASPLTGTDPTGHYTVIDSGSLSGAGYGSSGSSGYTTIPAGSYSSSGSSGGGQCIGSCYGGGGAVDSSNDMIGGCLACVNAGEASWNFAEEDVTKWYFENYVLPSLPSFSDEEAKRINVMAISGMTAPDDYWELTGEQRADFARLASWINFLDPSITEQELLGISPPSKRGSSGTSGVMTASSRGIKGKNMLFSPMRDPALNKDPRKKSEASFYQYYKLLIPYRKKIENAARFYKVDRIYLTATLLYELNREETQAYMKNNKGVTFLTLLAKGMTGSFGLPQLEPYKVAMAHKERFGKAISEKNALKMIIRDPIGAAALWMWYLHKTVNIPTAGGGTRKMTWAETAVAYCGCSGATQSASNKKWSTKKLEAWLSGNAKYPDTTSREEAARRWAAMGENGWSYLAALEFWAFGNS